MGRGSKEKLLKYVTLLTIILQELREQKNEEIYVYINPEDSNNFILDPRFSRASDNPSKRNGILGELFGAKVIARDDIPKDSIFAVPESEKKFFEPRYNPSKRKQIRKIGLRRENG